MSRLRDDECPRRVDRDALYELEASGRLLEQIYEVLAPLGITDCFRRRILDRIGSIQVTLIREWKKRKGGKTEFAILRRNETA